MSASQQSFSITPDHPALRQTTIVAVRPQKPENLGAIARVMKNFGLSRLALVEPHAPITSDAHVLAWNSHDILNEAQSFPDLRAAVGHCNWVCATTRRVSRRRGTPLALDSFVEEWFKHAHRGPTAIVFGPEDAGLNNDDLLLCQRWLTIPTSVDQPALNLAQAVAVICFLIGQQISKTQHAAQEEPLAPVEQIEAMINQWQQALDQIGFLNPQNPRHIMWDLRSIFARAELNTREVTILRGIATEIVGALARSRSDHK